MSPSRLRRPALAGLVLLVGCAAPPPPPAEGIRVTVRVSGAISRAGTYAGPREFPNACHVAVSDPVPGLRLERPIGPLESFELAVAPQAVPPAASFTLRMAAVPRGSALQPIPGSARLTAGGRLWTGSTLDAEPLRAEAALAPDLAGGRFRLQGLRPAEGGPERITVEGEFRCPP